MTGEITRKSVLIECLQLMREELNICSKKYNGLEPKEGMEEAWEQARAKVKILEELIHAYDSAQVRKAIADWQKEVEKIRADIQGGAYEIGKQIYALKDEVGKVYNLLGQILRRMDK